MSQYSNSNLKNKKGFIFTMDVAVSLVIVFTILVAAALFVTKANKDPLPNLQLLKHGEDVSRVLDYQGLLKSPNENLISSKLQLIVPSYYGIEIIGEGPGSCVFYAGEAPPPTKTLVSGKYYFNSEGNICTLNYKIWLK